MLKWLDAPYCSGPSKTWLKTKSDLTELLVIIEYQTTSGTVRGAAANLKAARRDGGELAYVGAVGTGFSDAIATMLRSKLDVIVKQECAEACELYGLIELL